MEQTNESKDLLLAVYGSKSFVKIYQALGIGKIKFSFAEKGKEADGITCWMNADDFVSDLINKIRTGRLEKMLYAEKKRAADAGEKYAKDVWKSRVGQGSAGLRSFSIQPGASTDLVFRATQEKKNIIVGCDYRELELLVYRWSFLEKDYEKQMYAKYTIENMKSSYQGYHDADVAAAPTYESEETEPKKEEPAEANKTNENTMQAEDPKPPMFTSQSENTATATPTSGSEGSFSTLKMKLKVSHPLATYAGGKCLKALTEDGEEYAVLIQNEYIKSIPNWHEFEQKASSLGTMFSCEGVLKDGKIYVKSIA